MILRCSKCLQVVGAHLSTFRGQEQEQDMWHEALMTLQKARKLSTWTQRLFASLRISYDALQQDQMRMFLDTAFFFLGRRADTAVHAWEGYAKMGRKAMPAFVVLCLIATTGTQCAGKVRHSL